jgi:hypothetical protein
VFITDPDFLAGYTEGTIRFYQQDVLHVRMHKTQKMEGSKVKAKNEITKVIEYKQAHPSPATVMAGPRPASETPVRQSETP